MFSRMIQTKSTFISAFCHYTTSENDTVNIHTDCEASDVIKSTDFRDNDEIQKWKDNCSSLLI